MTKKSNDECTTTILSESPNPSIDRLKAIYDQDRRKAKVIFDQDKSNYTFGTNKICLFEYSNGDFRLVSITRKYGISVTAVLYSRESNNWAISYKHKTKSFYFIDHSKRVRQLSLGYLTVLSNDVGNNAYNYMLERFAWIRNVSEFKFGNSLTFSTIVRHKLYNEKSMLRHLFKCPYPVAKMLSENNEPYNPWDYIKVWKEQKKVLINIDNLKAEFRNSPYFHDSTIMAASLGKKINCSWGLKRLKQEHDLYSKQIVDVILEFEPLRPLNIRSVYKAFAEFSGFELLTTNHDLIAEGKKMSHCVGTYSSNVNSGSCAIFRYKNHTLDVRYSKPYIFKATEELTPNELKKRLDINQFMGFSNVPAPKELNDEVLGIIDAFNKLGVDYTMEDDVDWYETERAQEEDLPF